VPFSPRGGGDQDVDATPGQLLVEVGLAAGLGQPDDHVPYDTVILVEPAFDMLTPNLQSASFANPSAFFTGRANGWVLVPSLGTTGGPT
jgi:hypothetical protein